MSNETKMKLTKMLVEDIGAQEVVDGITYVLLDKSTESDKTKANQYESIIAELGDSGTNPATILRKYDVSNGTIYDLDINVAKSIASFLLQQANKEGALNGKIKSYDLIADKPDKRRREDIENLGKYLKKCVKEGKTAVEVCLFSRNKVGKTTFNAKKGGKDVTVSYNAYAIRHWDIEVLNNIILANENFKVTKVDAGEIVPSKNGVRFVLHLTKVGR